MLWKENIIQFSVPKSNKMRKGLENYKVTNFHSLTEKSYKLTTFNTEIDSSKNLVY
jgi:hypothetical protein